ncbi:MAG: NifU family protein [Elusimicrobia bacterium]|nr:NifU family protein [Elusimicrobiota bacterium]
MKLSAMLSGNWLSCRFTLEEPLHEGGGVYFGSADQAEGSPLAEALFRLPGVVAVKIAGNSATVTRDHDEDWPAMARKVAKALAEHRACGRAALAKGISSNIPPAEDIRRRAAKVIEEKINPALGSHGGSVELVDVREASVFVRMAGGCQGCAGARATLRNGVERALREEIPQLDDVADVTDHASGSAPYQR